MYNYTTQQLPCIGTSCNMCSLHSLFIVVVEWLSCAFSHYCHRIYKQGFVNEVLFCDPYFYCHKHNSVTHTYSTKTSCLASTKLHNSAFYAERADVLCS